MVQPILQPQSIPAYRAPVARAVRRHAVAVDDDAARRRQPQPGRAALGRVAPRDVAASDGRPRRRRRAVAARRRRRLRGAAGRRRGRRRRARGLLRARRRRGAARRRAARRRARARPPAGERRGDGAGADPRRGPGAPRLPRGPRRRARRLRPPRGEFSLRLLPPAAGRGARRAAEPGAARLRPRPRRRLLRRLRPRALRRRPELPPLRDVVEDADARGRRRDVSGARGRGAVSRVVAARRARPGAGRGPLLRGLRCTR